MARLTRWALVAAAAATGATAGYVAERAVLRRRLRVYDQTDEPPLGSLAGELRHVQTSDGTRIAVESYGPADAPQLVFSHGWVCTGRVWHEQVRGLADRYRLITYDQPGHGRSSPPQGGVYDLDLIGDALATVLQEATRPGPVVLCGHSLGGMTILNAARRYPDLFAERVRAAALLSTTSRAAVDDISFGFGIHSVARVEAVISRLLTLGRPNADLVARIYRGSTDLSFLLTRFFGLSRDADPRYVDFTEQLLLDSDLDMITDMLLAMLTLDEDEALACLDVPTTIVCGQRDRLTPPALSQRMSQRCAHAEYVELPGIGHMTPMEAADTVNTVLDQLVTRHLLEAA